MGIKFKSDWDEYKRHFSGNQAFLDCFAECHIATAIYNAGNFPGYNDFLNDAGHLGGWMVTVEQGTHQPENLRSGGFCLHITARWERNGRAYHLYIKQQEDAKLRVFEITG